MPEPKRSKKIARGKLRLVTKSRWESPIHGSKFFWNKICEGIQSKSKRVRNQSTSSPILYSRDLSASRRFTSSVSKDDESVSDVVELHSRTETVDTSVKEQIPKIYSLAPTSDNSNWSESRYNPTFRSDNEDEIGDPTNPVNEHWRITKLSKMTKLLNDFLSKTRTRVTPNYSEKSMVVTRKSERVRTRFRITSDSSQLRETEIDVSQQSSTRPTGPEESNGQVPLSTDETQLDKNSVIISEDVKEVVEKTNDNNDINDVKPRRPRAPSLSIASSVPSFGRVIISIESIPSIEDELEEKKKLESVELKSDASAKASPQATNDQSNPDHQKVTHFLQVPEMKRISKNSYPIHERMFMQQENITNKMQTPSIQEEAFDKSQLLIESEALRKKYGFWPRRSIVHVFRALKMMKHGEKSKARIESETNRFFAAPLEIYSPSPRSSISSDDPTDFIEGGSGQYEEEGKGNGSEKDVGFRTSESSYSSVRERLMRNARTHDIRKDFQDAGGSCIDEDSASIAATSLPIDFSDSYNSLNSEENQQRKVKRKSKKTSDRSSFIALPPMARIFPRIKTDKCLACMYKSLTMINHRTQRQATTFTKQGYENRLNLTVSEVLNFECFSRSMSKKGLVETLIEQKHLSAQNFSSTYTDKDQDPKQLKTSPAVSDLGRSVTKPLSQFKDPYYSGMTGKTASKSLVTAKSLVSSLSMTSEHSKSDQDDSEQGCIDTANGTGLGATSKYLAPCHMPINFKPSLDPFKALKFKKSRSMKSRIASAEKSTGSGSEDENISDNDSADLKIPIIASKTKGIETTTSMASPREDPSINATDTDEESIDGSEQISSETRISSSKTDLNDPAVSENLPKAIISDREITKIASHCLRRHKTVAETLQVLANEYSNRLSNSSRKEFYFSDSTNVRKSVNVANNLLALLVDSKRYLYHNEPWAIDFTDTSLTSKQTSLHNSRQLRRVLPLKSYNLIAPILGMAKWYPKRKTNVATTSSKAKAEEASKMAFDFIVHPPTGMTRRVSFEHDTNERPLKLNPYTAFLKKPRRKAVTWRPLTKLDLGGYDPEATLKMRAAKITDRICTSFCQWLEKLATGTNQMSGIDADILRDMFETDFTAEVCRTMQVSINKISTVPDAVASARKCSSATALARTERFLIKDAIAKRMPKKLVGFSVNLPNEIKFIPPRNDVYNNWLRCQNVPADLETMDSVWKGITDLKSVIGFIDWLDSHPQVARPKALETAMITNKARFPRGPQEIDDYKDTPQNLDQTKSLEVGVNDRDVW